MRHFGSMLFSSTHLKGDTKSVPPPPLNDNLIGSEGPNSSTACTAASQEMTRIHSGCASLAMALISPANCCNSFAPIDGEFPPNAVYLVANRPWPMESQFRVMSVVQLEFPKSTSWA